VAQGAKLAAEAINKAGVTDGKQIKLVIENNKSNPTAAAPPPSISSSRNANVGQVFRPDHLHLQDERDRAFSERRLRPRGRGAVRSVAITFTNLEGGFWRSLGKLAAHGSQFRSVRGANCYDHARSRLRPPGRPSGSRQPPDNVERKLH
jgi:hypothetical protein